MPGWLSAARVSVDAVDPGQVDAADAVQFMAQVELRRMAARLPAPLGPRAPRLVGGRVRRVGAWGHHLVRHALEMLFERLIALGHPLLVGIGDIARTSVAAQTGGLAARCPRGSWRSCLGVAQTVISEAGADMTRWGDPGAFASWLGLCPLTAFVSINPGIEGCMSRHDDILRIAGHERHILMERRGRQ